MRVLPTGAPWLVASLVGAVGILGAATLTYVDASLPTTLNPLFATTMVDYRTHELVFDRLFYRVPIAASLQSRLVAQSEVLDDGRALKVTLVPGVKWHDGAPFGPDDVCFTIGALLDPKVSSPIAAPYREAIAGCTSNPGERTATVTFNRVYRDPRERLGFAVLPKHVLGGAAITPDLAFSSRPIGTGPMRAWRERREVRFEAYPNVHHAPGIPAMRLEAGADPVVDARNLVDGSLQGLVHVGPAQRAFVAASDDVALRSYDLRSWWFVAVNPHRGRLGDPRVRQALDLTLDREALRAVTLGVDTPGEKPVCELISGPFLPSSPYYDRAVRPTATPDPAKAAALLTAAGLTRGPSGWLDAGRPVKLTIGMNAALETEAPDLLQQVGNQLRAGGFEPQLFRISADQWEREAIAARMTDFDLMIGKWSVGMVEDVRPLFHSGGDRNLFRYANADVDALLTRFGGAATDTEAREAAHALHARLAEDLPYLFLWKLDTTSGWRSEVRGATIAPYYYFTDLDQWQMSAAP